METRQERTARILQAGLNDDLDARARKAKFWDGWFYACLITGILFAYSAGSFFFVIDKWDVSVALYTGLLSFNMLSMAVAWIGIAKINDILMLPKFLDSGDKLVEYQEALAGVHRMQVAAVLITLLSIGILIVDDTAKQLIDSIIEQHIGNFHRGSIADRVAMAATVTASLYAFTWSYRSVGFANRLITEYVVFRNFQDELDYVVDHVLERTSDGEEVGLYRVDQNVLFAMIPGMDQAPHSALRGEITKSSLVKSIASRLEHSGREVIIYEPVLEPLLERLVSDNARGPYVPFLAALKGEGRFFDFEIVRDLAEFKGRAKVILANPNAPELLDVRNKVFERTLFPGTIDGLLAQM